MYVHVYHNTEVHLNLCSGHSLITSTSVLYLLGTDLQTTFCIHPVGIIITQADTHIYTCVHTHTLTCVCMCICLTYRLINKFKNSS